MGQSPPVLSLANNDLMLAMLPMTSFLDSSSLMSHVLLWLFDCKSSLSVRRLALQIFVSSFTLKGMASVLSLNDVEAELWTVHYCLVMHIDRLQPDNSCLISQMWPQPWLLVDICNNIDDTWMLVVPCASRLVFGLQARTSLKGLLMWTTWLHCQIKRIISSDLNTGYRWLSRNCL